MSLVMQETDEDSETEQYQHYDVKNVTCDRITINKTMKYQAGDTQISTVGNTCVLSPDALYLGRCLRTLWPVRQHENRKKTSMQ